MVVYGVRFKGCEHVNGKVVGGYGGVGIGVKMEVSVLVLS